MNRSLPHFCLLLLFLILLSQSRAEPRGRSRNSRARGRLPDEQTFGSSSSDQKQDQPGGSREEKLLNIFQVVRFPNDACNTTTGDQGVCYTSAECTARSGSNAGSCASGFGVCCSFSIGCGGMTSQNNTYFVSGDEDTSPCSVQICKCSSDICQIRLDFDTFNIAQPLNDVADAAFAAAGDISFKTQCQNAQFVAASTGTNVPVICGLNTGQHMILEADEGCNTLSFNWIATTPRQWRIKTSQISCLDPNKPNEGCLQWYTGNSGTVQSFNFDGGIHLANQDQLICVRREQGQCQINWTTGTVMVSNLVGAGVLGMNGVGDICTLDYLLIPSGFATTTTTGGLTYDRYCGNDLYAVAGDAAGASIFPAGTVRSQDTPFTVRFITNSNEMRLATGPTSDALSMGFRINYSQGACDAFPAG